MTTKPTNPDTPPPSGDAAIQSPRAEREARKAAALRANLAKRKAQTRARTPKPETPSEG